MNQGELTAASLSRIGGIKRTLLHGDVEYTYEINEAGTGVAVYQGSRFIRKIPIDMEVIGFVDSADPASENAHEELSNRLSLVESLILVHLPRNNA